MEQITRCETQNKQKKEKRDVNVRVNHLNQRRFTTRATKKERKREREEERKGEILKEGREDGRCKW